MKRRLAAGALCALIASPGFAETSEEARARKPASFHAETGYRIERQRAPTPEDIPGPARRISASEAKALDAVRIDVFGAPQSRYDDLDGAWLAKPRDTLPGAVWLPEVGRGALTDVIDRYFRENLTRLTGGCKQRTLMIFCVADCWMSWNAAQRAAGYGYSDVRWLREGTDGWLDEGLALEPVAPVPVGVE